MIADPPLLRVRRRFSRPSAAQVAAFAGMPTGFIIDAMNGRGALHGAIKPIGPERNFHGVALPCHAGPNDNLAVFGALTVAMPGDVVLAATEMFSVAAVTGDLLLGMLKNCGVSGFVTDGHVRDQQGIRAVGLPCFAAGVTPNSPARNGPGTVGMPIVIGGVAVDAGDIVVGDEDGVAVVPFRHIDDVIARLPAIRAAEAALAAKIRGGLKVPAFIQSLLDAGRFEEAE